MNVNNQFPPASDASRTSISPTRVRKDLQTTDLAKQAGVAQATIKAVQEALSRTVASPAAPVSLVQLSTDSAQALKVSRADEIKRGGDLDLAKLDDLKAKIADGSFEIDFGLLAKQIVDQSMQQLGSKRGK
ncbi:MAG: hypothetical protein EBS54_00060 [Betaproteobacteria bacterium]|nr:hypothetical protein [Betaproteobacteria bacterium]